MERQQIWKDMERVLNMLLWLKSIIIISKAGVDTCLNGGTRVYGKSKSRQWDLGGCGWMGGHVCTCMCVRVLSHVGFFVTPWIVAHQAPLSMWFPKQECWNGLPFPTPEDLPNTGTELESLESPSLAGRVFTTELPGKPRSGIYP